MRYTIKENENVIVNAACPLFALRKVVNKIVSNSRKNRVDIFKIKNETITIECPEGKEHVYMFSIVPSNVQRSIYYNRDYEIRIFKLLRNL